MIGGNTGRSDNLPTDGQTRYGTFFGSGMYGSGVTPSAAEENAARQVLATGGSASNLYVRATDPPNGTMSLGQWTFTIVRNGVADTTLQCTIAGTVQTTCSDTTGSVDFDAGDTISIRVVALNNPNGSRSGSWSVTFS